MSKNTTRFVEMYSLIKWENSLRTRFCLGYDPYFFNERTQEGMAAKRARELLQQLGVFFYRDIENSNGIILAPITGSRCEIFKPGMPVIFDPPLECYFFNVKVLYPSILPVDYVPPSKITSNAKYVEYKEKWGDTKQWLRWNDPKKLIQLDPKFVKHSK